MPSRGAQIKRGSVHHPCVVNVGVAWRGVAGRGGWGLEGGRGRGHHGRDRIAAQFGKLCTRRTRNEGTLGCGEGWNRSCGCCRPGFVEGVGRLSVEHRDLLHGQARSRRYLRIRSRLFHLAVEFQGKLFTFLYDLFQPTCLEFPISASLLMRKHVSCKVSITANRLVYRHSKPAKHECYEARKR